MQRGSLRESTYSRDKYLVTIHVRPAVGRVKLKNLNAMHLHRVYREKLDDDLSPATVQEIHQVLHKALGQAVRWDLIPRNPAHSVEAPTPAPKEMRPLSVDEAKRLLEASGSMQHREPRSRAESAHPPTRISMRSRYMSW